MATVFFTQVQENGAEIPEIPEEAKTLLDKKRSLLNNGFQQISGGLESVVTNKGVVKGIPFKKGAGSSLIKAILVRQ